MTTINDKIDICLSGGADDADLLWGMTAGKAGHQVFHFSFRGHETQAPTDEIVVLTENQLKEADPYLEKANASLKRRWPASSYTVRSLLRRNFYQVKDAYSVYAVSKIKDGKVDGGTAWAVQMFLDRHEGQPCACYVYDQTSASWYKWEGFWVQIDAPPFPSGIWAGIGSRKLKPHGRTAIKTLMGYAKE